MQDVEDAEKCLSAGTELTLMGNILDCHRAINKNDLENKKTPKQKKDARNLYLVKEGGNSKWGKIYATLK